MHNLCHSTLHLLFCPCLRAHPGRGTIPPNTAGQSSSWSDVSGHCSDSLFSLPQEGIQLGLGGRFYSSHPHSLLSLHLGLNRQWANRGRVSLEEMSRKRPGKGIGMQGRKGSDLVAGSPAIVSKAQLCIPETTGTGGLGIQVRYSVSSIAQHSPLLQNKDTGCMNFVRPPRPSKPVLT